MTSKVAKLATLFVGLPPGGLTRQEQACFSTCSRAYLAARDVILRAWYACPTKMLLYTACGEVGLAQDASEQMYKAFCFLEENGYINTGFLAEADAQEGSIVPKEVTQLLESKGRTVDVVQAQTYTQLLAADLTVSSLPGSSPSPRREGSRE